MPRDFHPGHLPNRPLYPNELVYTSVSKIEDFLQLPLPDPVALSDDTSTAVGSALGFTGADATKTFIKVPISGVNFRRWGYSKNDNISIYDDADAMGSTLKIHAIQSAGSGGKVNLIAENGTTAYTTSNNAVIQSTSAISHSKERGINKEHVENLIKIRQDYIDSITRMAWRPRLISDEYQNFTTFKPYRRRYYTDYVGAVYLKNRAVQRVLRLAVWQGDYYRELASSRICLQVQADISTVTKKLSEASNLYLSPPNSGSFVTLTGATNNTNAGRWNSDFGKKSVALDIAKLINAEGKDEIQIGALTDGVDSEGNARPLNLNNEFLATANSDEGDGRVLLSSMRSTDEGDNATLAFTYGMSTTLGRGALSAITSFAGSTLVLDDPSEFVKGESLIFIESVAGDGITPYNHVGFVRRYTDNEDFTLVTDATTTFATYAAKGAIAKFSITSGGDNYTSPPTVSISTSTGSNFAGTAVVHNKKLVGVIISNPGSGYLDTDVVSISGGGGSGATAKINLSRVRQIRLDTDAVEEKRQKDWWSMEDNGAIMFNNQYPFFENHSLKICYIFGERYVEKTIEDACTKLVAMDILLSDDYTVLFPEGTNNIDLNAKIQKMDEEVKRMLIPYQESIIVAGMGG